jgi:hypothetical protein
MRTKMLPGVKVQFHPIDSSSMSIPRVQMISKISTIPTLLRAVRDGSAMAPRLTAESGTDMCFLKGWYRLHETFRNFQAM